MPASGGVLSRDRFLPLAVLLFIGSGCAALIYEVVWFQLLQQVLGSSSVSLGVLLGTFMGGMCAGSLALPRVVGRARHPLRVYAAVELGIGICGLLVLLVVPAVGRLYTSLVGHGLPGILLRAFVAAVCLLPPTFLMGASLPAIARWVQTTPRGVSWMGFFYAGNIAGAVAGCLLAGFYLLRVHDMVTATFAAVLLNAVVAAAGWLLAARVAYQPEAEPAQDAAFPIHRTASSNAVLFVIGLSGFTALSAEVIWTRLLSLMMGASVYTFSILLAVFLTGLGIGSAAGSAIARETPRPRFALGLCQLLLGGAIAWTAWIVARSLPFWPVNPNLSSGPWYIFQMDLARAFWAMLPATILWGASFPLAVGAAAGPGQDPGRLIGRVYAANTLGAILGAIGSGMVLVPWIGTQRSQQVLIAAAAIAAALSFWPSLRVTVPHARRLARVAAVSAAAAAVVVLLVTLPAIPWMVIAYGRHVATSSGSAEVLYVTEGMNASVAISRWEDGQRMFHVSGKVEASSEPHDMRLQRMLGHLPALIHPHPRSVLVVGFGAGVTAGSFVTYPGIERIVICEIEPRIPPTAAQYFQREQHDVLRDPRVTVVYDDARHYILTTRDTFDIITSDPIHPWVKGTAALYSTEYFQLCRRRLNPGGVITQWVPLYESDFPTVKSELATFFEVFPNGTIWANDVDGSGYDTVLLAANGPLRIDVAAIERRMRTESSWIGASLGEVGFFTATELLATYAGRAQDLRPWLKDAQINHDRNLRLQYLAGLGLNNRLGNAIYQEMLRYRKFPADLFENSSHEQAWLRQSLGFPPEDRE